MISKSHVKFLHVKHIYFRRFSLNSMSYYLEKDSDSIYEEFNSDELEDQEEEYRDNDRMDDMISKYGY
jgi:hypothetical protein